VAAVGLLLLSPIFIVTSVLIKAHSRGPILETETAYGYGRQAIPILKFRTVRTADFVITRVGQLLHQTDIVKLPMLFNVLLGDLSLIGASPFTSDRDVLAHAVSLPLLAFRPGLIAFRRIGEEGGRSRTVEQRINDDLYYVEHWSLFLDIKTLLAGLTAGLQSPYPGLMRGACSASRSLQLRPQRSATAAEF
jgi:lipopolysaccharide/colanic/teichoic acid biosynthesis glycosyltransferase